MRFVRLIVLVAAVGVAIEAPAPPRAEAGAIEPLRLTETETLSAPDLSVLAFHNHYPSGKQGGIEIIHRDRRVATNGEVVVRRRAAGTGPGFPSLPVPTVEKPARLVDRARDTIRIPFTNPDLGLAYTITVLPEGVGFAVVVDLEQPLDASRIESLRFEMELYPGAYRGRAFASETDEGVLPWDFASMVGDRNGERAARPLAQGRRLVLAQDAPGERLEVESEGAALQLVDGRHVAPHYWFRLVAEAAPGSSHRPIALHFRPERSAEWRRPPVIAHSQIGYHPAQRKIAVLELDPRTTSVDTVRLERLAPDGSLRAVHAARPQRWGRFLRYEYARFDFSDVREPGLYRLAYGETRTAPFRIADDVFREGAWQPVVETFLPVQMCHMRVRDRGRLWHGACHLDDGLQARTPLPFFDGFAQSEHTETAFAPDATIPGLGVGGWHDAGDDDINTGSTGRTVYHLALLAREFGATSDQTTIDAERREVELHRPDGKPDVLQQLAHGVRWLLAAYRVGDHSFVGVISHDWDTYVQAGDWAQQTDGLLYDPALGPSGRTGTHSGRPDDRYVFTNEDSRSEYFVAGTLAAASTALGAFEPALAEEALRVARGIWEREQVGRTVEYPSVGTPESLVEERTNAAVELHLATGEPAFLEAVVRDRDAVLREIERTAWTLTRVEEAIPDASFRQALASRTRDYSRDLAARLEANPFGTAMGTGLWGQAWDILWKAYKHYFLVKRHPELFPKEELLDALEFALGRHPGSDLSLVSSVGAHRPIPAFGINRADYGHIPGGVYSGVALVQPDFPELKDDHPFLWQQSEYIVFGATPYAFCVLAADALLAHPRSVEPRPGQ